MKLNLAKYFIPFLLIPLMWSCGDDDSPELPPDNSTVTPPTDDTGSRTILVYMVADNSLGRGGYDEDDLAEMRKGMADIASTDDMKLLVYHSRPGTDKGNNPQLIEITGTDNDIIIKEYPDDVDIYSTDPERMRQVLDDVRLIAPASDYGIIFWSHATGWMQEDMARIPGMQRSYGDDRRHRMSIPTLANVLNDYDHSFIYFDCCLMSTVEVAYELRHTAPVIVASGAEEHGEGMPYDITLPYFFAPGDSADIFGAAKATFNYYNNRKGVDRWCTISVIDTSALDLLADVTRKVMETGASPSGNDNFYQSYSPSLRYRVFDMAQYITTLTDIDETLVSAWNDALNKVVVYRANTPKVNGSHPIDTYCGLGCNILRSSEDAALNGYSSLAWWNDVVSFNELYN